MPFQSPQKPKGDCDNTSIHYIQLINYRSNHPKSRKAIVTFTLCSDYLFKNINSSNHPKSRKAIVTTNQFRFRFYQTIWFQSPQKPKGDCDCIGKRICGAIYCGFQSPQKPKGDCDRAVNARYPRNLTGVPITPKAERRL